MNCTTVGELSSVVPTHADAAVAITSAAQVVVQILPVTLGTVLWIVVELARRKRAASDHIRRLVRILAFTCTLAVTLVVWRFTSVLACEVSERSIVWNVVACAVLVGISLLILFALALCLPRAAILACLLLASGVVVTDVGLRGWWDGDTRLAAQHLMPVQILWVIHVVAVLFHLRRAPLSLSSSSVSRRRISQTRSVVDVVDALSHARSTTTSMRI